MNGESGKRKREDDAEKRVGVDSGSGSGGSQDGPTNAVDSAEETEVFSSLKLPPLKVLREQPRLPCPNCKRSRKIYCYDCLTVVGPRELVPKVSLPIHCHILHYHAEKRTKSTAIHAPVLAPTDVTFWELPNTPDVDPKSTVLLYPSSTSIPLKDVDLKKLKNVLVVDSTWQTAHKAFDIPMLETIPHVRISSHHTRFWRYQKFSKEFLATIEAIYYFYVELDERMHEGEESYEYDGKYDNLMLLYAMQRGIIDQFHIKKTGKVFEMIPRKSQKLK